MSSGIYGLQKGRCAHCQKPIKQQWSDGHSGVRYWVHLHNCQSNHKNRRCFESDAPIERWFEATPRSKVGASDE